MSKTKNRKIDSSKIYGQLEKLLERSIKQNLKKRIIVDKYIINFCGKKNGKKKIHKHIYDK